MKESAVAHESPKSPSSGHKMLTKDQKVYLHEPGWNFSAAIIYHLTVYIVHHIKGGCLLAVGFGPFHELFGLFPPPCCLLA